MRYCLRGGIASLLTGLFALVLFRRMLFLILLKYRRWESNPVVSRRQSGAQW
jgi:hypothetical protein